MAPRVWSVLPRHEHTHRPTRLLVLLLASFVVLRLNDLSFALGGRSVLRTPRSSRSTAALRDLVTMDSTPSATIANISLLQAALPGYDLNFLQPHQESVRRCLVQADTDSRGVALEEWLTLGSSESVDSFASWRQQMGTSSVSCESAPLSFMVESPCLECVSRTGAVPWKTGASLSLTGSGRLAASYTNFQECLDNTHGIGFCKRASVSL